ncbi:outer membrane protein assembly factor BamE [Acidocella sp.]|uniref:outer membrane protein assembly factor BamE n=1 Tax=Acidocella sp. TaxID=50710 RepID=UPI002636D276|nr:outer membrane protein assembly factor BamE [Acidocella sp.]
MRQPKLPLPILLSLVLALPGCAVFSDAPHYRGVAVSQHDLNELVPGVSTQADAQALLGPPSFIEQFDQNNWVYASQVTHMRIGQTEGMQKQHVVVLTFAPNGTLQGISQKDTKDAVQVAMDGKTTPMPGGKASFIQMVVGGVGSYNPLGAASSAGGGASAAGPQIGGASPMGGSGL